MNPLILLGLLLTAKDGWAKSATVRVLPVTSFGQEVAGCRVSSMKSSDETRAEDFSKRFHGLIGSPIPFGKYRLHVQCGVRELYKEVMVDLTDQLVVIALRDDLLTFDHVKYHLTVVFPVFPDEGDWWITLDQEFGDEHRISQVSKATKNVVLVDVPTGRYLFTVHSTRGYGCSKEVDVKQFSKQWSFDASNCSLTVDRFAHVVERAPDFSAPLGAWEKDMAQFEKEFRDDLEQAVERSRARSTARDVR